MKRMETSLLLTELSDEKATAINGGQCGRTGYSYPSKPWGAGYHTGYRPQSYIAHKPASFRRAASRLDSVLFE